MFALLNYGIESSLTSIYTFCFYADETLGIKTSVCESTVQKEVYSADYINAAYIPDHQVTMYPDMILEDLTFRQWNDGEIADLPFPSKQMKIKACRSDGSLRGLQFYIDASTPNTDYSGILGMHISCKFVLLFICVVYIYKVHLKAHVPVLVKCMMEREIALFEVYVFGKESQIH